LFRFWRLAWPGPRPAGWLAFPAGVIFEGGGAGCLEPGEELAQAAVVVDPGLVVVVLAGAEPAADGPGGDLAGPLPVRAVQPGRVGVAAAVGPAAAGVPLGDGAIVNSQPRTGPRYADRLCPVSVGDLPRKKRCKPSEPIRSLAP